MSSPEIVVVAAFRRADLVRLHALLLMYDSPFTTTGEDAVRREDEREHRALWREIERLLASTDGIADGGTL